MIGSRSPTLQGGDIDFHEQYVARGGGRKRRLVSGPEASVERDVENSESNIAEYREEEEEAEQDCLKNFFEIIDEQPTGSRSRGTRSLFFTVKFKRWEEARRPDQLLERALKEMMQRVLGGHPDPKLVGIQVHPSNFRAPFTVPLRPPEQNSAPVLSEAIFRLQQQYGAELDLFSGTTEFKIVAVWPVGGDVSQPNGAANSASRSGEYRGACSTLQDSLSEQPSEAAGVASHAPLSVKCQSLVAVINPQDRYSMARAVLIGLAWRRACIGGQEGSEDPERMLEFKAYCKRQQDHGASAERMLQCAGVSTTKQWYDLEDIRLIQLYLNVRVGGANLVRLVVFSGEEQNRIIFKGAGQLGASQFNICLYLESGHFSFIARPEQLFRVGFFFFSKIVLKFFFSKFFPLFC